MAKWFVNRGKDNMKQMFYAVICMLSVILIGPTYASTDNSPSDPVSLLDSDDDKTIDISEMGKAASDSFDILDSDGDGKIDFRISGNRLSRQEFKKSDTNKDDMLDKNEYFAVCDSLLRLADQDKDGTLDANEFKRPEGNKLQRLIQ